MSTALYSYDNSYDIPRQYNPGILYYESWVVDHSQPNVHHNSSETVSLLRSTHVSPNTAKFTPLFIMTDEILKLENSGRRQNRRSK